MSLRRAFRSARLPLAGLVVACAFTCSAGAARSASNFPEPSGAAHVSLAIEASPPAAISR